MRYVIVSIVHGAGGEFNNNLRREVFEKFKARSSKLPAHFTIKAPFEVEGEIKEIEDILEDFTKKHSKAPYKIDVKMSKEGKEVHDRLIDELSKVSYINFDKKDGKNKIIHVTISSKKIRNIYNDLWEYVNEYPCKFNCSFDNVTIYKWQDNTWKLHKEYVFN